jgi:hypothetical protein
MMSDVTQLLAERTRAVEDRFLHAVTLEVRALVAHEIEARGRTKADFFAGFTPEGATIFRARWEKASQAAVDSLWKQLVDLRTYYAGTQESGAEGRGGLLKLLNETIPEQIKQVLNKVFVPADSDDYEGITNKYRIQYTPSPSLVNAWQEIRDFDTAFMQIDSANKAGKPISPTFEIRFCIPEALG